MVPGTLDASILITAVSVHTSGQTPPSICARYQCSVVNPVNDKEVVVLVKLFQLVPKSSEDSQKFTAPTVPTRDRLPSPAVSHKVISPLTDPATGGACVVTVAAPE